MIFYFFIINLYCKYARIYNSEELLYNTSKKKSKILFYESGSFSLELRLEESFNAFSDPVWFFISCSPISSGFSLKLHGKKNFIDIVTVEWDYMVVKHKNINSHLDREAILQMKFDKGVIVNYSMEQVDEGDNSYTVLKVYLKEK